MFRTVLRNVLAYKSRLLMTVLAVTLGVAFVSGTLIFTDTIGDAYKKASAKSFQNVSVAVRSTDGADHSLTDGLLTKLGKLPGVASATGEISGFTALADKDGKLVGQSWGTRGTNYSPGSDGKDHRYAFTAGRPPQASNEIALDSRTAERTGFTTGDTARLSTSGPVMNQKVTGIFDTDDGSVIAGGTLVLFDNTTAHKVLGNGYDEIILKSAPGTSDDALKQAIEKIQPNGTETTTGKALASEQGKQIAEQNKTMADILLYFAAIALFVGMFIIANTFTMLVAQRTKELALLRLVVLDFI